MPVKLFTLNNVPDDEAEEVRELLRRNAIDFYETPAGFWGVFVAAIWLPDENQLRQARQLIDRYQSERLAKAKEEYAQQQREGSKRTIIDLIKENPLRFLAYLAAIAAVIYFSTKPFMDFGK
jgi:hypothetical protein